MTAIRRSFLYSGIDKYVTQVVTVGTTAIMARLLTPADTGLFLVASAVVLLADNFRDFGVGAYIMQARQLSREAVRSAFTVTLLLSAAIGAAVFGGAGQIAAFYGQPEIERLIDTASLVFLFAPFATPALALLKRDLAFGSLAWINIAVAVGGAVVTIGLGSLGFGPMSYVWGFVSSSALMAVLAVAARREAWVFVPSLVGIRAVLGFGGISAAVTVTNMACDLLPRLAFGRMLGFDAVGLYGRALTVCQLPDRAIVSALQPVVLPAMAAHARAGGDLRHAYLRGHELMTAFQWPALVLLALLADPVVQILLGPQWTEVPALVRPVALASIVLAPAFMTYPVLVAAGRVRDTLVASLISLPPSVVIMIAAATQGLPAVAASFAITAPLQTAVALMFIRRAIGLSIADLLRASRASALLTLTTALIPAAVIAHSPTGFALNWLDTGIAVAGAAAGWITGLYLLNHPVRHEIAESWRLVRGRGQAVSSQASQAR